MSVKQSNFEPGKVNVEFQKAGSAYQAVEIYNNIDTLVNDKQRPNYGALNYKATDLSPVKRASK